MRWQAESVSDDELAAEWVVVDDDGKLVLFMRDSAVDAAPGRMAVEIMAVLRMTAHPPANSRAA